ncbi:MAG: M6 family metalloprotease domain-containing protein [Rikenellaceae bacterium]|nr:M6 family metalloprotease domain-containing protein [Rikenellaceae bacterium]
MGKKFIIIAFLLIQALSLSVNYDSMARPARKGKIAFMQPDGSSFVGSITGDEFFRLKMTETGESIIRDEDGWWCYAAYDALGNKYSSGVKVGVNDIAAKTASRQIPYAQLIQRAAARRAEFDNELALKREKMRKSMTLTKAGAGPVEKHGIIILAAYSDVAFTYSKQNFENMMNQSGYSYNGATGSAKDYFEAQFGNMYNFTFDVSDIVTLPNNRKYYGQNVGSDDNDARPQQMVSEACTLAEKSGVDFSRYDDDGDGYVDTVFVIFAGDDEADSGIEDCIWAHAWSLSKAITLSGKKIFSYACASELGREVSFDRWGNYTPGEAYLAGIGTFCHEYSHTFGLADLYDTDYSSNGHSEALWSSTGLMDGGNMNNKGNTPPNWNAIDRVQLGVGNCIELTPGKYDIKPISENGDYYKLETGTPGEYYLIECRDASNVWDSHTGGSGMLVYHIDRTSSAINNYWAQNAPNAYSTHQCADLIEADQTLLSKYKSGSDFYFSPTVYESHYNDLYRLFFPYNNVDCLDKSYALTSWYGAKIDARIENICRESDGSISFNVVDYMTVTPFQNEALIEIQDLDATGAVTLDISNGSDKKNIKLLPDESGDYRTMLEGLTAGTQYTLELNYQKASGTSTTKFKTFRTLEMSAFKKICLDFPIRKSDGSFPKGARIPLAILNAQDALKVEWYFNSGKIRCGSDYKWAIPSSGELKAVVTLPEGEVSIYKKITVK